jgi:hypothetical protein
MIPLIVHLGNSMGSEVHDVAITSVAPWPNLTLPSYLRVNVTVENQGNVSETFNVTVHADNLTVTSATVIEMAPGSNETLKLACDLFPFREVIFPRSLWTPPMPMIVNVTVWAEATVTVGEANTTNNVLVGGQVSLIWWWTDLNGDGRINIIDIAIMAKKFGSIGGWHPCWDFDGDERISILDMVYVAKDYRKVYYEPSNLDDP